MKNIDQTLTELTHTFQDFKTNYDRRLKGLERFDLAKRRPEYSTKDEPLTVDERAHKEAFALYLRKGDASKLLEFQTKALTAGVDAEGGFFLPTIISDKIKMHVEELSPFRSLASVMTISSGAVDILLDENTSEVGWTTETAERRETKTPQVLKKKITLHELYARPKASQRLIDDAQINIEDWVLAKISDKIAIEENLAFIHGDGYSRPKGFLTYETLPKEKWDPKTTFEHIGIEKVENFNSEQGFDILIDLMQSLKPRYHANAVWVMSRSAEAMIRKLKDKTGQFLWQPGLGEKGKPTLFGYRVVVAEGMPEITTKERNIPLIFGNFKESYQIVDRADTQILRDPYSSKPYVEFYTTRRVGGDVLNFESLKMLKIGAK